VKLFSSKKRIAVLAALIVLALFLLRPGASRIKTRLVTSISAAVGRPVEVGAVRLRLLPRPGFDLDNLVVYDDPEFGAEPMLRASEVTADVRLISLMRGRLEIARLDLTDPSLNLVHSDGGRWNVAALLERNARIPLAPTGKAKSEARAGFPYIAATGARINFKQGAEKRPYAFTNADFSLWQESDNTWGMRLKADPFRSDINLLDTGDIQLEGRWQRAESLRDTPFEMQVEWRQAQLGQVSKFFTGQDWGWRGAMQLDATLRGTPAKLQIASDAILDDFRRYDITNGTALRLAGHCNADYSSLTHQLHEVVCEAPVGTGLITLKGEVGLPGSRISAITISADDVPANAAIMLARRVKRNLPEDLTAEGMLRGSFTLQRSPGSKTGQELRWEGQGEIKDFHLSSASNDAEIGPQTLPFVAINEQPVLKSDKRSHAYGSARRKAPEEPHVEFGPIELGAGRTKKATARGRLTRSGYEIAVAGETEIAPLLRIARMMGVPALPWTPPESSQEESSQEESSRERSPQESSARKDASQVDLRVAGSWRRPGVGGAAGFAGPQVTGTASLRDLSIALRGTDVPVEIASAEVLLGSDRVSITKLNAKLAGTTWTGSMEMPRGCATPSACRLHFALNASQIVLGQWNEWANPTPEKRPWYRALEANPKPGATMLENLRAEGRLTVDRLQVQRVTASRVSASVRLEAGKLDISELNADVFGGKHSGHWQADFAAEPTTCNGSGALTKLSLSAVADTMKDNWITGTASGSYELKGPCQADFWDSAEGTLKLDVSEGILQHMVVGDNAEALQITRMTGRAQLQAGQIEFHDAKMDSPAGKFELSGTASFERELDLKLGRAPGGTGTTYTIGGTLAEPKVTQVNGAEQATLKP
jgi:hypothetical protein